MTFLFANWKLVVIAILSALLALTFKLWRSEAEAFGRFRGEVAAIGAQAKIQAEARKKEQDKVTKEIGDSYAANMRALRTYYDGMLKRSGRRPMPATAERAESLNGTTSEPPPACADISASSEDALKLHLWQEWARELNLPVK